MFIHTKHKFCWDIEHNTVVRRVWENHAATRLHDFWYEAQKKAKKTSRDRGFQGWNDVAVWRDFKPIYIPEDIWPHYLEHVTSERFTRRSQSGVGNRNRPIHGGVTTHIGGSVPFAAHAKRMAASLGREPSPMELFVEMHVRSQDRQKGAQQFVDNRAQHFVETYNNQLRERYGDDTLTHSEFDPDLWMEVGSSGGPDKIGFMGSPTLRPTTCGRPVVFQPLGAPNQYRAPNLRSLWLCSNSPKNTITYKRSTHNSKYLMHNKERSLSNSKRLKHNKRRSMKRLKNSKKRLITSFTK